MKKKNNLRLIPGGGNGGKKSKSMEAMVRTELAYQIGRANNSNNKKKTYHGLTEKEWVAVTLEIRDILIGVAKEHELITYSELCERVESVAMKPFYTRYGSPGTMRT